MILYPNAKINIGLDVINKRHDGYHNISSVFYPLDQLTDILEIRKSNRFLFSRSGIAIPDGENICVSAFKLLQSDFNLSNVKIHIHKRIPVGSGLGGGSADAAFTLKAINTIFMLELSNSQLEEYALKLGADCPFFIENTPKYVEGIGEQMLKVDLDLSAYVIQVIPGDIHIDTSYAYSLITPYVPLNRLKDLIKKPIGVWQEFIKNDFEDPIFKIYPALKKKKDYLLNEGAIYSSMTGSGSALFGIFKKDI